MKILKYSKNEGIESMARIGWIPAGSKNSIEVYVNTDDPGKKPHFHVRKYGKHHHFEWETCILFNSANYFLHGKYHIKFPKSSYSQELDEMLRTIDRESRNHLTFWQEAIDEWNRNNSDVKVDPNMSQPDYSKLKWGK